MFSEMTERIRTEVLTRLYRVQVRSEEEASKVSQQHQLSLVYNRGNDGQVQRPVKRSKKVGRNEPCPCGSGKKYKKCCGVNA
ncbi:MAG TPA: hypothetical protein ENI58_01805 [Nitrospirae bacterium]|nr:hypothetical protein [Nitrospirota bacterium]